MYMNKKADSRLCHRSSIVEIGAGDVEQDLLWA